MMNMNDTGDFVSNTRTQKPAWDKEINWFDCPADGTPYTYRLVARPFYFKQHWISVKKNDGSIVSIPFVCKNWDSTKNEAVDNGCVHCAFVSDAEQVFTGIKKDKWPDARISKMPAKLVMASNVIPRLMQRQGPPANAIKAWSYIVPMRFSPMVSDEIKSLAEKFNKVNVNGNMVVMPLNHVQYGRDVNITYAPNEKDPKRKYSTQLVTTEENRFHPITQDELGQQSFLTDFSKYLTYPEDSECKDILEKQGYYKALQNFQAGAALGSFQQPQMPQMPQMQQPQNGFNNMQMQMPQMPQMQQPQMPQAPTYQQQPQQYYQQPQAPVAPQMPQAPVIPQAPQMPEMTQQNMMPPVAPQAPMAPQAPVEQQYYQQPQAPVAPQMPQMPQMPQAPVAGGNGFNSFPKATEQAPVATEAVQAPVVAAHVAPAASTAPTGMAVATDLQTRVSSHAAQFGIETHVRNENYPSVTKFKQGMTVHTCFADFLRLPACKECPVKLDCMSLSDS